jgi:hypothetical protein
MTWNLDIDTVGVLELPSGCRVRGRGLSSTVDEDPDWGLYLTLRRPVAGWPSRWVCWPDFGLPLRPVAARDAIREAWARSECQRIEVACGGGVGRTGTALASMAMLDGLGPSEAIAWVRERYHPRAVETPWQRRWLKG